MGTRNKVLMHCLFEDVIKKNLWEVKPIDGSRYNSNTKSLCESGDDADYAVDIFYSDMI